MRFKPRHQRREGRRDGEDKPVEKRRAERENAISGTPKQQHRARNANSVLVPTPKLNFKEDKKKKMANYGAGKYGSMEG